MATLEQLRLEADLTRAGLAKLARIDRTTVERAESGQPVVDLKAYRIAQALSRVLGRPINYREIDGLKTV